VTDKEKKLTASAAAKVKTAEPVRGAADLALVEIALNAIRQG
jgi:hypothetical protein